MLGDIIAKLDDSVTAEAVIIEAGDLALLDEVREAAALLDMDVGTFSGLAARRFVDRADADAWLHLVGAMGRSDRPGLDALRVILKRAVADAREAFG